MGCYHVQDQELLLQFSAAYMIVDFFMFLIPYSPTDVLFIGHHIMTTWWAAAPHMGTSLVATHEVVLGLQHGLAISIVHGALDLISLQEGAVPCLPAGTC